MNIVLFSYDVSVFSSIQKAVSGLAVIECADLNLPQLDIKKYDILIVDFRKETPLHLIKVCIESYSPKYCVAMIDMCSEKRRRVFEQGFSDYIVWPIIENELETRIKASIRAANSSLTTLAQNSSVERCCRYMLKHIDGNIKLPQLCRILGTNQSSLSRKFQDELGVTPMVWLRDIRLHKAAQLLQSTNNTILNVAHKTGYADSNNFSTAFRSKFGLSPSKYRKSKKIEDFSKVL